MPTPPQIPFDPPFIPAPSAPGLYSVTLPLFRICMLIATGLGCAVLIEPAPCDVFVMLAFLAFLFGGLWLLPGSSLIALSIGLAVTISHGCSLLFAQNLPDSLRYFLISFYLMASWWLWSCCGLWFGRPFLCRVFQWWLAGALLSTTPGILAHYHLFPHSEIFLRWERVKGLFKDPNVYGPYLVPPFLYLVHRLRFQPSRLLPTALRGGALLLLGLGVVFSFSRGALANLAVTVLSCALLVLPSARHQWRRMIPGLLLAAALLAILSALFVFAFPDTADFLAGRLRMQPYDEHRFENQWTTLLGALEHPWGIGPGESRDTYDLSPHNSYIRLLIENGFPGLIISLLWAGHLLACSWRLWFHETDPVSRDLRAVLLACLLGIAIESFIIDTLHWRHLFLLLGFAAVPWRPHPAAR